MRVHRLRAAADYLSMRPSAVIPQRAYLSLVSVLSGLTAGLAVLLILQPFGSNTLLVITDTSAVFFSGVAAAMSFSAARATEGHVRKGWPFLCAGTAAWALGELVWGYYEVGLGIEVPFPSLADAVYLSAYPLLLVGMLYLATSSRVMAQLRTVLDAMIVTVVATAPVWVYVLKPIATTSGSTPLETILGLAYPAGDLLLLFGLSVAALRRQGDQQGNILGLFCLGLLLFLAADMAFALQSTSGAFATGSLVDIGWLSGYCLIAVSAAWQVKGPPASQTEDQARLAPAWRQAVPLFLLFPAICWLAFIADSSGDIPAIALVLTAVLLVTVRGTLTVVDILALNSELESARVRLETANEELRKKSRHLNTLLLDAVDLSRKDSLTGLLNHGAILEDLARAIRDRPPVLILALLDVDDLKMINDTAGHQAGDAVLREIAGRLLTIPDSIVGRYGGDEFVAFTMSPEFSADDYRLAISDALEGLSARLPRGAHHVSMSCGLAMFPFNGSDVDSLVSVADSRLYIAKNIRRQAGHERLIAA
jgi:diguanylate cyclase (GGDEF)-like protein